jgi:DNA-binding PadR family transcriptional regulator
MGKPEQPLLRDFFLGFVRIHVLHHACQEDIYGAGIKEELARHGYDLSPGSLYPLLQGMEKSGLLHRENRLVEGRVRKYYRCTKAGRAALARARRQIQELVKEVMPATEW